MAAACHGSTVTALSVPRQRRHPPISDAAESKTTQELTQPELCPTDPEQLVKVLVNTGSVEIQPGLLFLVNVERRNGQANA